MKFTHPIFGGLLVAATLASTSSAANLAARDRSFGGPSITCSTGSRPGDCAIPFDVPNSIKGDEGIAILETIPGHYILVGEVALAGQDVEIGVGLTMLDERGGMVMDFGTNGRALHVQGAIEVADAAIDSMDRALVAGRINFANGSMDIGVFRYTPQGFADPAFGENGRVEISCGDNFEFVSSVNAMPDGGVLVLAAHSKGGGASPTGFCAVELSENGAEISHRRLDDTDTVFRGVTAIHGESSTYLMIERCIAAGCANPSVSLRNWNDPLDSPDAVAGPFEMSGCGFETMGVEGSTVSSSEGRLLLLHGHEIEDGAYQGSAVGVMDKDGLQIHCLDAPGYIPIKMLGHGAGVILFGNAGNKIRVAAYELPQGMVVIDASFNAGEPLDIDVLGYGAQHHGTQIGKYARTPNVVAWDRPAAPDDPARILIAGTRTYFQQDTDFAVVRLGEDGRIFRSGFEAVPD